VQTNNRALPYSMLERIIICSLRSTLRIVRGVSGASLDLGRVL
jgi:hypothetical protein